MNLGGGIDMDIGSLLNKLIENDKNGKIVNELIEQGILKVDDIVNYVCSTNDFSLIHYVSKYVKNADIGKLEDKILCISDFSLIFDYLKDVSNVSVSKFEDKFIESDNASNISYFSFLMIDRGINVLRLENRLYELGKIVPLCDFIRDIKGSNINRLYNFMINNGSAQDLYVFASALGNIGSDRISDDEIKEIIDNLTVAMIKTNDIEWISIFSKLIRPISVDKMIEVIKNRASINYHELVFSIDTYGKDYIDEIIMNVINQFDIDFVYNVLVRLCFRLSDETIDYLLELVLSKSLEIEDMTYVKMLLDDFAVEDKKKLRKIKKTLQKNYNRSSEVVETKVRKRIFFKK